MTHKLALGVMLVCAAVVQLPAQFDAVDLWIRANAVPIGGSGRAMRALDADIAGARLIGVGESVHDVQQFMTFRLALLQDLVRRHRVTALILETGLPEAMAADDFVQGRIDQLDYASALGGGYNQSEVTRETLQWIRDWNLGEGRARPVALYGADVSIGDGRSMLPALDRLSATVKGDTRVAPLSDAIRPIASRLSAAWWGGAVQNYATLAPETKAQLTGLVAQLVDAAAAWPGGTAEERAWATRFAALVQQGEAMLRLGSRSAENPRDASMAANVRWLVERLPDGERAMVWAHNAHVQRSAITLEATAPRGVPSMGVHLGRDFGSAYFSIGTAYAGPSMDDGSAPAPGSVDGTLAASLLDTPSILLLRGAPDTGAVGAWLRTERAMRYQVGYLRVPVAAAFDAIAYFDRVEGALKAR